ncbi:MAG: hypothetical protein U5L03_14825 [Burkholderiaceae bacterium]|nr:hypothetical protein [Burkholderiaceae bacterium]
MNGRRPAAVGCRPVVPAKNGSWKVWKLSTVLKPNSAKPWIVGVKSAVPRRMALTRSVLRQSTVTA